MEDELWKVCCSKIKRCRSQVFWVHFHLAIVNYGSFSFHNTCLHSGQLSKLNNPSSGTVWFHITVDWKT